MGGRRGHGAPSALLLSRLLLPARTSPPLPTTGLLSENRWGPTALSRPEGLPPHFLTLFPPALHPQDHGPGAAPGRGAATRGGESKRPVSLAAPLPPLVPRFPICRGPGHPWAGVPGALA